MHIGGGGYAEVVVRLLSHRSTLSGEWHMHKLLAKVHLTHGPTCLIPLPMIYIARSKVSFTNEYKFFCFLFFVFFGFSQYYSGSIHGAWTIRPSSPSLSTVRFYSGDSLCIMSDGRLLVHGAGSRNMGRPYTEHLPHQTPGACPRSLRLNCRLGRVIMTKSPDAYGHML